jgi:hypothetical protein
MDDVQLNRGDAVATYEVEREKPSQMIRSGQIGPNYADINDLDIGGFGCSENSPQIHELHKLKFSIFRIPSPSSPQSIQTLINDSNFILKSARRSISISGDTYQ